MVSSTQRQKQKWEIFRYNQSKSSGSTTLWNSLKYDMRYFVERLKKFGGMEGEITKSNLPKINPLKLLKIRKELLERIHGIISVYIRF